jgi:hypothetical protein
VQRSLIPVALAAALVTIAACSASSTPTAGPASSPPAVPPSPATIPAATPSAAPTSDLLGARTQADIDVPGGPDWPLEGFGSLWVLAPDGEPPTVTRIDPITNEISATIPIPSGPCQALGVTEQAVWACAGNGAAPVDPESNVVGRVVEFEVAQFFGYMPSGAGSLWVLGGNPVTRNLVVRIDPEAGAVTDTYPLDFDASWISFGADALWITDTAGGAVWRLDPDSGEIAAHITGLPGPGPNAVGAGSLWQIVRNGPDDRPTPNDVTLVRFNTDTGEIEAEIVLGGTLGEVGIYADETSVWVRAIDPFVVHVDPVTNEVLETFEASRLGGSLTVAFDSVWATSYPFNRVWRISPR